MDYHQDVDTIKEFIELWVRSGLATDEQASQQLRFYEKEFLPTSPLPDTITSFCAHLVSAGALSVWQCQKLRSGKWKGLFLDEYLLIDQLGGDEKTSLYLAQNKESGKFVRLTVVRPPRANGPGIQYSVDANLG